MPEEAYISIFDIDGTSNGRRFELDEGEKGVEYRITASGEVSEHEFTGEGSMGETVCRHFRQCPDYYFSQFDSSDGTLRLPPAVTTVSSLDIAYTPITFWEDFDSSGDRAFYVAFRDTTSTPDIVIKKYRVTDDVLVDTELSTDAGFGGGAATETAPRIGRVVSFEGNTFFAPGEESGSNHIQKIAVGDISAGTADTYTEGDHFTSTHAVIEEDGEAKFLAFTKQNYRTAVTTPETDANYGPNIEVGDSGSPVIWSVESGGFVYASKTDNLYELDPTSARPLLDMKADRKNKPFQDYDDFDGHMSATIGAAILYPHRTGFWRYRSGRTLNLSIDNIPGYREVANVVDAPIGLRHYATDAVGQWVYAIYKPPGFANTTNCNIMSAFYQPGAAKELLWRTLITRNEDLIGLKIDSDKRLWFVQNPNDPAVAAATVTFVSASSGTGSSSTSVSWSHTISAGSQRILTVGISTDNDAVAVNAVSFGAQAMTIVAGATQGSTFITFWSLVAPLVSTANIVATFGSAVNSVGGAADFTGVDQSQPFRGVSSNTAGGSDTAPTITITSATNDIVVDTIVVDNAPATTIGSGQTEHYDTASGSNITGSGSREAGASSVTMSWSLDATQTWGTIALSLQPGALGSANADLNYVQLNLDGSPRTTLGRNRGAVSTTYEHYMGEIRFDRRVQARYMKVETENLNSTTSLQLKIHRDGGGADSIGSAITSDDFHQIDFTVGTTDLLRRARMRLTLDTNGSYAPATSDPRMLRGVLGIRSPDTYKAVMRTGNSIDSARTQRKILRQRKGAGTVQITESWSGTQFRADVTSIRDLETRKDAGGQLMYLTEITFERHDVES